MAPECAVLEVGRDAQCSEKDSSWQSTQRDVIPAETVSGNDCSGKHSPNTLLMYIDGLTDIGPTGGLCIEHLT